MNAVAYKSLYWYEISSKTASILTHFIVFLLTACILPVGLNLCQAESDTSKRRIFIVSSYDRDYLWSQSTHAGVTAAMLRYGYIDNETQLQTFTASDYLESSRAIVKKAWMDTKRHNSVTEIAAATLRIMGEVEQFQPDLVLLGDDNAANYIGNQLLDTDIPVVFWGINSLPLKYGLVDSMDRPGHNVTGVWQAGYYKESMDLLHTLVPSARTFAVLACNSVTARPKVKQIVALDRQGKLPLKLVAIVQTNSYEEFQYRVLELAEQVDAFFVLNHDTMRDAQGHHVDMLTVGRWYLRYIRKPEASHEDQFVREGMLLAANDSGYNQAYTAFEMAYDILEQGLNPGLMRTKTPPRGPLMVNRRRAEMLGIDLEDKLDIIDEIVVEALALD
ncbi:MAG: ABC transporter substrate binding protein [Pseudomonadota bacterium]